MPGRLAVISQKTLSHRRNLITKSHQPPHPFYEEQENINPTKHNHQMEIMKTEQELKTRFNAILESLPKDVNDAFKAFWSKNQAVDPVTKRAFPAPVVRSREGISSFIK